MCLGTNTQCRRGYLKLNEAAVLFILEALKRGIRKQKSSLRIDIRAGGTVKVGHRVNNKSNGVDFKLQEM